MRKVTASVFPVLLIMATTVCPVHAIRAQVEQQELLPPMRSTLTGAAHKLVDEANTLFRAGELAADDPAAAFRYFHEAKTDYALAWDLTHDASLAYDVALCLWRSGDYFEAHYWMKVYYGAFGRQLKGARTAWDERGVIGEQPYRLNERIILAINDFMHEAGWNTHTSAIMPFSCTKVSTGKCVQFFSLVTEDRFRDLCREMKSCERAERAIAHELTLLIEHGY